MAYFIDLFSPETYEAFSRSTRTISGFRQRHKNIAERIKPGDVFICYLTRLSRWFGLLEVLDGPYIDQTPIFVPESDPFIVRFHVRPKVWLDIDKALPIHDSIIWNGLSFTRDLGDGSNAWTGKVRGSLVKLDDDDGKFLSNILTAQAKNGLEYPISELEARRLDTHTITRADKVVSVSVPEEVEDVEEFEVRESIQIQALLATIGAKMGMTIWIPKSDRALVLNEWDGDNSQILERLPLNYDDTTLKTI